MARYRYEARDMVTGDLLAPSLPLKGVRWETALDPREGGLTARLNLNVTAAGAPVITPEVPEAPGHIAFPDMQLQGNWPLVPLSLTAGATVETRLEFVRPPVPVNTNYGASSFPMYFRFSASSVTAYMYASDITFPFATATYAALVGFPEVGAKVQIKTEWDDPTETLAWWFRSADQPLDDDTAPWTLGATANHPGKAINHALTYWQMVEANFSTQFVGNHYRWMMWLNGALHVDVNPAIDLEGVDPDAGSFECTTGQTVTVAHAYSVQRITFPGTTGNRVTVPDAANLDITGDLCVVLNAPVRELQQGFVINKSASIVYGNVAYALRYEASDRWTLYLENSTGGLSSPQTSTGDLTEPWVALTLDADDLDDGTGKFVVRWYDSPDGSTWTLRRTNTAGAGIRAVLRNTTDPLEIGGRIAGTQMFAGALEHVSIRSGTGPSGEVGGTEVFLYNERSTATSTAATTITATTGQTMTISRSGDPQTELTLGTEATELVETVPAIPEVIVVGERVPLAQTYLDATRPRRTVLWVYRDEVPVDALRIMRRPYPLGSKGIVGVYASPLMSYFDRRRVTIDRIYNGQDQLVIARALLQWAQAVPHGNVNIEMDSSTSGVTRTQAYKGFERSQVGRLIAELANQEGGFEYGIVPSLVADEPVATFTCWYPHRGRSWAETRLTFTAGRNLLDYGIEEDGTESAVTWYGIGRGEGTDMLVSTASDASLLDQGYPLDENVTGTTSGDADQDALDRLTELDKRRHSATGEAWQLLVKADDVATGFGTWTLGDEAKVIVEGDARYPSGVERILRIMAQGVDIPDDGGPERIILTAEVPVYV